MPQVRVTLQADERGVLLDELEGLLDMTAALYGQIGRTWDGSDPAAVPRDVAPVLRARDQLAGDGPWTLQGSSEELSFLLGRLRAAAELALARGAEPSPADRSRAMSDGDAEGTDFNLDVLGVCDALTARLDAGA